MTYHRRLLLSGLLASLLLAPACNHATGPEWKQELSQRIGIDVHLLDDPDRQLTFLPLSDADGFRIEDPIDNLAPLELTVISSGSSSCTRPGPVALRIRGPEVTIRVFDYELTGEDVVCTADVRLFPRTILHTFVEPGEKTIHVLGSEDELVVELTVVEP